MFHPISGKLVGAVGLACWHRTASPLLMAMVKTTADQITRALLTDSSAEELELLQGYLRACRHGNGIVLALNHDLVMMNDQARYVLEQGDQEVLLGYASEVLAEGRTNAVQVELPTGLTARMHCRPAGSTRPSGTPKPSMWYRSSWLVSFYKRQAADVLRRFISRMLLPGLVGSGALWLRSSQQVQESYQAGEWLALEGEPGVGKLALARAVHQRRNPARRFDVFDAPEAGAQDWMRQVRRALLEAEGDLVLRHVDQLGPRQAHSLAAALQEARPGATANRMWVAVTLTQPSTALTEMLRLFPTTVALPPLRHHIEDLPELAQFFLGKLSQQGRLTCSPEAMKLLMRSSWPGNVEQLWQVIRRIVQRRRVGSIRPEDLPPEWPGR